ncbi:oxidoreductase [Massilia aurea]|uniref:Oxidoreductase n=1 Tax=Massilia aurea TaxID=373040 RepID=A0A422QDE4_9BURK|nr:SDR family NAD(P)-dependent oxidoreductase [Massilia aurea]RNF27954.1 oxidoreductase [Massilia aurea]
MNKIKTWLITGCAQGLGRAIAETVLANGDRLVATARRPALLAGLQQRYGAQIVVGQLDVTDAVAAQAAVQLAVKHFGGLDVLVNNAGYASLAPFEQMAEDDFKTQMDTNFYGVVNLTRAVLPLMRGQRAGHIINISSGAGRLGMPGMSAYHAAKFAVGGFTESVAKELAAFGVQMVAVEPGSMPTSWAPTALNSAAALLPEYEATVGHMLAMLGGLPGNEIGDLSRYAQVIFDLSRADRLPNHLILGSDALYAVRMAEAARDQATTEWEHVSTSTDRPGADLSFLDGLKH